MERGGALLVRCFHPRTAREQRAHRALAARRRRRRVEGGGAVRRGRARRRACAQQLTYRRLARALRRRV